jgi:5-methylcytosine-specific restriction endonuclease McrA
MRSYPKPPNRLLARRAEQRRQAKAFRDAVWARDGGRCRKCSAAVVRVGEWWERGEVHHMRGRNVAPEDRYNPLAAVLLCQPCHRRVTEHADKRRGQPVKADPS